MKSVARGIARWRTQSAQEARICELTRRDQLLTDCRVLSGRNNTVISVAREVNQMGAGFTDAGTLPKTKAQIVRINARHSHLLPGPANIVDFGYSPVARVEHICRPSSEDPAGFEIRAKISLGMMPSTKFDDWKKGSSHDMPEVDMWAVDAASFSVVEHSNGVNEHIVRDSRVWSGANELAAYRDRVEAGVNRAELFAAVVAEAAMDPGLNPHLHN